MTATAGRVPLRHAAGGAGAGVAWSLAALLAVTAVFAGVAAVDLVHLHRVIGALPSPATHPLRVGQQFGTAEMLLFYGHLIAVVGWLRLTAAVLGRFDDRPFEVLRTAPIVLWRIGVAATIAAAVALPHADLFGGDRFRVRLRWMEPILAARLALVVLLVLALIGLRRRVHAVLLRSGVAPSTRRPPPQSLSLLEIAQRASVIVPPLPVAGDAWCADAVGLATAAGQPLPLLESSGDEHRRWLLVAPGSDPATLRQRLLPGAVVTLFPTAPSGDTETGAGVPARAGLIGLIEAPDGELRWDDVGGDDRLAAWRLRAARSGRSGLYALDDPEAVTAAVPR